MQGTDSGTGKLVHYIDDLDLEAFLAAAAQFGVQRCGYVVTPNVDHLIRCTEDAAFLGAYRAASYVLLDSRVVALLLRIAKGLHLPVCPGSDLTPALLSRIVQPSDRLVLIGGSAPQAQSLVAMYGLKDLHHHNPPMGFIKDPAALEQCLQFIENASPFRFCLLAVGSPQQEALALLVKQRARAHGLMLCIGASVNFITGVETRAPRWMQRLALEWLYRLAGNPRRLAHRYLVRGPRILACLHKGRFVRRAAAG